jgi:exodeoxyribonuclease VII large subunit
VAGFAERLAQEGQLLDDLASLLAERMNERLGSSRRELRERTLRLAPRHLREVVRRRRDATAEIERRLGAAAGARLREANGRAAAMRGLLESLSPLNVLERGYAICINPESRTVVRSAGQVTAGDPVEVRLARGQIDCRVLGTREAGSVRKEEDGCAIDSRPRNETRKEASRERDVPDEHGKEDLS